MKAYLVYDDNGIEIGTVNAGDHNAAEKKARKRYGPMATVAYTERIACPLSATITRNTGVRHGRKNIGKALKLVETRDGCQICETHPRYDVLFRGKKIGQLRFNMRGYAGPYLPQPNGVPLEIGECSISACRKAVAQLNQEWAEADREGTP